LGGLLVGIGSGLVLVYARVTWKEATTRVLAQSLPWLVTAFGLLWILVPHPGTELEPNLSLFIGLILLMVGWGLRLWWIREWATLNAPADLRVPTWPRLLMGIGLATSTGSLIVVGASALAGTIWWLGTQSVLSSHSAIQQNQPMAINPILTEVPLGVGMLLLTFLTFFIRSV